MSEIASHQPLPGVADAGRRYLPGMGRDWLLPLYDPFTRLIGIASPHRKLAEDAELESADRVLEIGCGTGNLALMVKRMRPQLEVLGLDPGQSHPYANPRARSRAESCCQISCATPAITAPGASRSIRLAAETRSTQSSGTAERPPSAPAIAPPIVPTESESRP